MGNSVDSILFRPPKPATPLHPSYRFFIPTSKEIKIPACYFKRAGAQITLLYSHANAEDLGLMFGWLKCLSRKCNVNILAYDYIGYGESEGIPSEENCYASIDAAYDHLINYRKLDPKQIVIWGRSVGSGPATYLASKLSLAGTQVGGLILESPFKSVFKIVMDMNCTVLGDKFPNADRISSITCPTLIMHGTNDKTIPSSHGKELYELLEGEIKASPLWVEGRGHNDLDYNYDPLVDHVNKYLNQYLPKYKRKNSFTRILPTPKSKGCIQEEKSMLESQTEPPLIEEVSS